MCNSKKPMKIKENEPLYNRNRNKNEEDIICKREEMDRE